MLSAALVAGCAMPAPPTGALRKVVVAACTRCLGNALCSHPDAGRCSHGAPPAAALEDAAMCDDIASILERLFLPMVRGHVKVRAECRLADTEMVPADLKQALVIVSPEPSPLSGAHGSESCHEHSEHLARPLLAEAACHGSAAASIWQGRAPRSFAACSARGPPAESLVTEFLRPAPQEPSWYSTHPWLPNCAGIAPPIAQTAVLSSVGLHQLHCKSAKLSTADSSNYASALHRREGFRTTVLLCLLALALAVARALWRPLGRPKFASRAPSCRRPTSIS